jgi:hypothetical protein
MKTKEKTPLYRALQKACNAKLVARPPIRPDVDFVTICIDEPFILALFKESRPFWVELVQSCANDMQEFSLGESRTMDLDREFMRIHAKRRIEKPECRLLNELAFVSAAMTYPDMGLGAFSFDSEKKVIRLLSHSSSEYCPIFFPKDHPANGFVQKFKKALANTSGCRCPHLVPKRSLAEDTGKIVPPHLQALYAYLRDLQLAGNKIAENSRKEGESLTAYVGRVKELKVAERLLGELQVQLLSKITRVINEIFWLLLDKEYYDDSEHYIIKEGWMVAGLPRFED